MASQGLSLWPAPGGHRGAEEGPVTEVGGTPAKEGWGASNRAPRAVQQQPVGLTREGWKAPRRAHWRDQLVPLGRRAP